MTDFAISKLVGMRTYCDLRSHNPELYEFRAECPNYCSDHLIISDVDVLISEGVDMYEIKKDLQCAVENGYISDRIKTLVHSSWSCNSPAMSWQYSIIWISIIVLLVSIIIYVLIMTGTVHRILQKEFKPDMLVNRYYY
jgi:hypothetical protein